ncbi:ABC1 kinase family protein [Frateuria defendens]|uniref:ABC1 kinase family protein n=1 Tax=Frateuria defendens TaxID=2219559 RepID=UPI00066FFE2C|nr:AarF/UbiB family protein [Frateuria defendens]
MPALPAPAREEIQTAMAELSRYAKIAAFVLRYRHTGLLHGLSVDESLAQGGAVAASDNLPERFVADLERLGPTFIKLGQVLSTRPDLVPPPYLAALERIQDKVASIDAAAVRAVIEAELGRPVEAAFGAFDPVPLAAGSLAQVHAVTLRDGRAAIVKVQRPGVGAQVMEDLAALDRMAAAAQRYTEAGRRYGIAHWVDEFRSSLLGELDFLLEADNLDAFADNLRGYPRLWVPRPVSGLCTVRVLTMERVIGRKVSEAAGLPRTSRRWGPHGEELLRAYLDQVFVHGLVHADPHPGNVMVTDDGRVALVDLGMVARLSPQVRSQLLRMMLAAVDGDGDRVAAITERLGSKLADFDPAAYRREICTAVSRYETGRQDAAFSEGRLLLELTVRGAEHGLRPPSELTLLGKTLLNLETVLLALDRQLPVREVVRSHLQRVLARHLLRTASPAQGAASLLDLQDLAVRTPAQLGSILQTLADNRFRVRLDGLEESRLIENLQKIANRISTGVITAALVIAGAMLARVPGGARLFGYPVLALLLFALAAALGASLAMHVIRRDRTPRDEEPGES